MKHDTVVYVTKLNVMLVFFVMFKQKIMASNKSFLQASDVKLLPPLHKQVVKCLKTVYIVSLLQRISAFHHHMYTEYLSN